MTVPATVRRYATTCALTVAGSSTRKGGDDSESIVLDLVQPQAAGRQLTGFGWEARRDEPGREGTLQHNADS